MTGSKSIYAFVSDIPGLIEKLGLGPYDPTEWFASIDGGAGSLKCNLHSKKFSGIFLPVWWGIIGHEIKECYPVFATIIADIKYDQNQWNYIGDYKTVSLLLGHAGGTSRYGCSLCFFDTREAIESGFKKLYWPMRTMSSRISDHSIYIENPRKNIQNAHNQKFLPLINPDLINGCVLHTRMGIVQTLFVDIIFKNEPTKSKILNRLTDPNGKFCGTLKLKINEL